MKKNFLFPCLIVLAFAFNLMAQTPETAPSAPPAANPADVTSIDAIIKSVYDVISGEAGAPRDWNRFRSLFHPSARMIPTGKNPNTGAVGARALAPDDYAKRNEAFFAKEGFFEREIARKTEVYGNIAHVFSTYEGFKSAKDEKPFVRGINSIQLLNDGTRWWVMTIYWQAETPDNPLPEKYLKSN